MTGLIDRITGRFKKAAGDLADDPKLRQQGVAQERKADAKESLAHAQREADRKAEEVARLERETARDRSARSRGAGAGGRAEPRPADGGQTADRGQSTQRS